MMKSRSEAVRLPMGGERRTIAWKEVHRIAAY